MTVDHFHGSDPNANTRRIVAAMIQESWVKYGTIMAQTIEHDVYRYCQSMNQDYARFQPYIQWLLASYPIINDWQQILASFRGSLEDLAASQFIDTLLQGGATIKADLLNRAIAEYTSRVRRDLSLGNQLPQLLTRDLIEDELRKYELLKKTAMPSGILPFDEQHDGFFIGSSISVTSMAKQGKSSLLTQIAITGMARGLDGLYVNIEDSRGAFFSRIGAAVGGVNRNRLLDRENQDKMFSELARARSMGGHLHIANLPFLCSCNDVALTVRELRNQGFKTRFVILDQLSLMQANKPEKELRHRYDAVAREMNEMAQVEDLTVFTVLQSVITKESKRSKMLDETDIAEAKGVQRHFETNLGLTAGNYEIMPEDLGILQPFRLSVINTRVGAKISAEFVGNLSQARIYSAMDTARYRQLQGDRPEDNTRKE
jgi:KaiC/GvpD/RAD55 family RecA-like ATPase